MYERNKKNLTIRTKLAARRINELMTNLNFSRWKMLWNSFISRKVMAAGTELLVDYSFSGTTGGKEKFSYKYDVYPTWVKKLDTQYRNFFWNKEVPNTSTIEDIPLMPSQ